MRMGQSHIVLCSHFCHPVTFCQATLEPLTFRKRTKRNFQIAPGISSPLISVQNLHCVSIPRSFFNKIRVIVITKAKESWSEILKLEILVLLYEYAP